VLLYKTHIQFEGKQEPIINIYNCFEKHIAIYMTSGTKLEQTILLNHHSNLQQLGCKTHTPHHHHSHLG
jgi:hypothetical protein